MSEKAFRLLSWTSQLKVPQVSPVHWDIIYKNIGYVYILQVELSSLSLLLLLNLNLEISPLKSQHALLKDC